MFSFLAKFNNPFFRLRNGSLAQDLFKEFIWNLSFKPYTSPKCREVYVVNKPAGKQPPLFLQFVLAT